MSSTASSRSALRPERYRRPGWLASPVFGPAVRGIIRLGANVAAQMAREDLRNLPRAMGAGWFSRPFRRRDRPTARELLAKRAAWERFRDAFDALDERRDAFATSPSDLTAKQVRLAEVELEDAVAVAGEFQVYDLPWNLV